MKLVVLDPIYLNKRHNERLKSLGKIRVFHDLPNTENELLQRINDAEVVITSSVNIDGKIIRQCRSLKMICLACSGYNRIDIETCNSLGITVANVPSYAIEAVTEHVFALLLALMRKIKEGDEHVRSGKFDRRKLYLSQMNKKVFGIIGTGKIGSQVAKIANAFGCKVIANTLHPSITRARKLGIKYVKLRGLLRKSNIISLHVPLNSSTVDMIGFEEFSLMKKKPILINTSRGKVINHKALIDALSKSIISGAGLDVLSYEPPRKDDPLLKFPNIVFSPHNAFCTPEALETCADIVVDNIEAFAKGKPKNTLTKFISKTLTK